MEGSNWIILLVAIPMASAIVTTMLRGWTSAQRVVMTLGLSACFGISIGLLMSLHGDELYVSQAGDWPAPFGITIVFDQLSGLLLSSSSFVALCIYIYGLTSRQQLLSRGWSHPLLALLVMGVNFSFLTGDLFNLFVAFEIMLMASYALMGLDGTKQQLSQTYKYVLLNLIGSTIFVLGAAIIYGMTGTLNYADLAVRVAESTMPGGQPLPPGFAAVTTMLLFVFALKAALFPLWFWLPDTYHTCSIGIAAIFSALLTKVGVYAMVRLCPMILAAPNIRDAGPIMTILPIAAGLTMLLGGLAALSMRQVRRVLAMLLISHIGYMAFGLAIMTPAALSGTVFYMIQHMLIMAALFLGCGLIEHYENSSDLADTGGLQRAAPWLSALFFIAAVSLIGFPPLSGFFGKLILIREGFRHADQGYWLLSVIGLVTGFFTLLALGKVWARVFWGPRKKSPALEALHRPGGRLALAPMYTALILLVIGGVALGLGAEVVQRHTALATRELNEPRIYVAAVLGGGHWPIQQAATDAKGAGLVADAAVESTRGGTD